jgi:hypothetical protein
MGGTPTILIFSRFSSVPPNWQITVHYYVIGEDRQVRDTDTEISEEPAASTSKVEVIRKRQWYCWLLRSMTLTLGVISLGKVSNWRLRVKNRWGWSADVCCEGGVSVWCETELSVAFCLVRSVHKFGSMRALNYS